MPELRQAALCIHGLSYKDQKWVLKKLPKQQRLAIKGMLRELDSIGIPTDQDWLPQVEEQVNTENFDKSFDEVMMKKIDVIDKASLFDIKKLLLVESDDFVASVMVARHWSWQEEFLGVLSKQRKSRIEYLLDEYRRNQLKKNVTKALLSLMADELEKHNGF